MRVRYVADERIVYRVSEVARMLDCDMQRIYRHVALGTLSAIDVRPKGSPKPTYRITRESLEAFLAARSTAPVIAGTAPVTAGDVLATADDVRAAGAK